MKISQIIAFLGWVTISFVLVVGCSQTNNIQNNPSQIELTISAAASLKDAIETIKPLYLQENPDIKIIFNFASSGSLQRQIEQGAPVNIFISAAPRQMNALQKKGLLLNETRQDLLTNQMVLIVPKNNTQVTGFKALTSKVVEKMALAQPESAPAGRYGKEVLTSLGIFDKLKPKIVYGKDVRQVLNYVATGNVDAGIVYNSDTKVSDQVKIVETAPPGSHTPIVYPIAVLKDSPTPEAAKDFVEFMFTPEAEAKFKEYGFGSAR